MKTTEFINLVDSYKKKLLYTNIVWAIISILLIGTLFFQIKKYDEKNLVVISDNGRFTAQLTNEDALYYFDLKNFAKVLVKNIHEYDKSNFILKLDDAKQLMDEGAFKVVKDGLAKVHMSNLLSDPKVKVRIDIDSIKVFENQRPMVVQCYLKQNIISDYEIVKVNGIGISFAYNSTNKSENNPFGLQATGLSYFVYGINTTNGLSEEQIQAITNQNLSNTTQAQTNGN